MNEISFKINTYSRHLLKLKVKSFSKVEDLIFKFSEDPRIDEDTLSIALSTLCGRKFKRITFDWPISVSTSKGISGWTGAEVHAAHSNNLTTDFSASNKVSVLNFSGGLDSLACLACLGDQTELVSLDFGGRFARERRFFKNFDTKIIKTNLIETSLRANSWSFMGLGSLLFRNILEGQIITFGSVLEAGGFHSNAPQESSLTFPPFKMAKYRIANSVAGISEAGTIAIVATFFPKLLKQSLLSVALPGEEKYIRKNALADLVGSELGFPFTPPPSDIGNRIHYSFGENFTVDLTTLFFLSRKKHESARMLVGSIPSYLQDVMQDLTLDFMLKADQNYYTQYPAELRPELEKVLSSAGISWYSTNDYTEIALLKERLAPHVKYRFG